MSVQRQRIENIKVKGLLSFGQVGIDLPLQDLNVFIGANASGKSNFFEVLNLLRSTPESLQRAVLEIGVEDLLHKPRLKNDDFEIEIEVADGTSENIIIHCLHGVRSGKSIAIINESIATKHHDDSQIPFYSQTGGKGIFAVGEKLSDTVNYDTSNSVLSIIRNPSYKLLTRLTSFYESIRMFRDWSFGINSLLRQPQRPDFASTYLMETYQNLVQVLQSIYFENRDVLPKELNELYESAKDLKIKFEFGFSSLSMQESGGIEISLRRLSDGTLRYLTLLAILLNPSPSGITVIEEPELGLHPDIIPHLAKLLEDASTRTQLFVSTHSHILADALSHRPEAIIACEQRDGESQFERLDKESMKPWLEKYSLGDLWSRGLIGANRW